MSNNHPSVFITGACGDIGRSLAFEYAQAGARIALCDLVSPETAAPLIAQLEERCPMVLYGRVDVTDAGAVESFVDDAAHKMGSLDICVVNAGIVERGMIVNLAADAWRRTIEVNLTGAFLTAQATARAMLRTNCAGQIIFISSWVQDIPKENIGAYCASKGGLKMLAKCLALELGPNGIRVNLVAPGWVDAGLTGQNLKEHPQRRGVVESQIPLGRLASAGELARAVRLLSSDDASYIHGATLLIDGGSSLGFKRADD